MGYFDAENLYSGDPDTKEGQQMLATGVSDNIIDHQQNNVGPGEVVRLCVQVKENFDDGTLAVAVETADNEDFIPAVTLLESAPVDYADLRAGYKFPVMELPRHTMRYSRLVYTLTGSPTTGAVWAGLETDTAEGYGYGQP